MEKHNGSQLESGNTWSRVGLGANKCSWDERASSKNLSYKFRRRRVSKFIKNQTLFLEHAIWSCLSNLVKKGITFCSIHIFQENQKVENYARNWYSWSNHVKSLDWWRGKEIEMSKGAWHYPLVFKINQSINIARIWIPSREIERRDQRKGFIWRQCDTRRQTRKRAKFGALKGHMRPKLCMQYCFLFYFIGYFQETP